ncbi:MAG: PCMD domain-containing protein [Cytophagales bacterium]|nr:PCMD domain-containing protein [Cytophaga sp.]
MPYSDRPTAFNVYYKYISVKGDSCAIYVLLFKYNTVTKTKDTIGRGNFLSNTSVAVYTPLTIPITYKSAAIPDSITMVFTSSAAGAKFKGYVGSSLTR